MTKDNLKKYQEVIKLQSDIIKELKTKKSSENDKDDLTEIIKTLSNELKTVRDDNKKLIDETPSDDDDELNTILKGLKK